MSDDGALLYRYVKGFAFVYVIGSSTGPQKVGRSVDVPIRLCNLRREHKLPLVCKTAFPVPLPSVKKIEARAHVILKDRKVRTEWFDVTWEEAAIAVRQAISDILGGDYEPRLPAPVESPKFPTTPTPTLSPVQCRAARAALMWPRRKLAEKSGTAETTIQRLEQGKPAFLDTVWKLRKTFEREGLSFPDDRSVTAKATE